ncbi:uncharacterized protein M421DRAFT_135832 [Didymella exigua CBS 183.55]|uniref:Uncharacterized protein n=1 Tax=Didymella exigua CBS 183.55 TaxID=1150837 RepID=A0A6A5RQ46_9PLEO|nr:uncharacterized protein M421DRAFT_135832 [Didymella exigua CBS 183.55]KAF1929288.1 hypothetical protein M421DRAFT_135832 [Didymella exigua CBS 183.55]
MTVRRPAATNSLPCPCTQCTPSVNVRDLDSVPTLHPPQLNATMTMEEALAELDAFDSSEEVSLRCQQVTRRGRFSTSQSSTRTGGRASEVHRGPDRAKATSYKRDSAELRI